MVDAAVAVENIAHITSALHVAGIASTVNVNCLAGCSGAAAGAHTAVTQAGLPWTVLAHQGGSWTVAATQSGGWAVNVAHIAVVVHVAAARPLPITLHMQTASRLLEATISATTIGDTTLVSGVAGQRVRIHRLFFVANAATTIRFRDATADLTGPMLLAQSGAVVLDLTGDPWFTTTTGHAFGLNQSAGAHVGGRLYYTVD
jgi:hypothetical protein